ncbi:N-acetyltransferase [Bacteroidia bacterium]|nr:N-acetyltransferase [Bacteroidia bacterium]
MSKGNADLKWDYKRVDFDTVIKLFDCGDDDLNNFLLNDAKNYLRQRLAVTYIFENDMETIGYFCLSNDTVLRQFADKSGWKKIKKSIPNAKIRSNYPAIKIGRLAVSKKFTSSGFGKLILLTVLTMYFSNNPQAGCRFITVDAYQNAIPFYVKNDFDYLTTEDENESTRLMYFDLNAIE